MPTCRRATKSRQKKEEEEEEDEKSNGSSDPNGHVSILMRVAYRMQFPQRWTRSFMKYTAIVFTRTMELARHLDEGI